MPRCHRDQGVDTVIVQLFLWAGCRRVEVMGIDDEADGRTVNLGEETRLASCEANGVSFRSQE